MITFQESRDYYPIILIPKKIKDGVNFTIPLKEIEKQYPDIKLGISKSNFPISLKEPKKPLPYELEWKTKYTFENPIVNILLLLPFVIPCLFVLFLGIGLGVFNAFTFLGVWGGYHVIKMIQEGIQSKKYSVKREIPKNQYEKLITDYNREFEEYDRLLQLRRNITRIEEKELRYELLKKRDEVIEEYKFNSLKAEYTIIRVSPESKIKKGKSELHFLRILLSYFGENIKVGIKTAFYPTYFPDFVYTCPKTGLYIDIEIDEVYDFENKSPIHFKDGNDEERNHNFLENNWIVIRFSEKQVLSTPEECCKIIDYIVKRIKSKQSSRLQNWVEKEKRWTYEEALLMIEDKYRNK